MSIHFPKIFFFFIAICAIASAPNATPKAVATQDLEAQIARVETGLPAIEADGEPPVRLSLTEWMGALDIPGLSIAVIDDYRILWAKGYGVRQAGSDNRVTQHTIFQAASISKPVTALAVLHHVERNTFALDTNINDYLRSWKLADNEFTDTQKVTLRHLLSHTAGMTPGGFLGYEIGAPLPDLMQILNGESPATNNPALVIAAPGSMVNYSGLGYTIIQLALTDQLGLPFPKIMKETVFEPLGLKSSTFMQHLPHALSKRAASGHLVSGEVVKGKWHVYPEMAAAGLWTTPSDLATVAIEVAKSKSGKFNHILSAAMTSQMLAQQRDEMGLGFVINPTYEYGFFAHSGGNQGYRCHMRAFADTGKGLVIMTNSDNGNLLFFPLIESVAREYGWPSFKAREVPHHVAVRILERVRGAKVVVDSVTLAQYVGKYEMAPGMQFDVILEDRQLKVKLADQPRFPVYPESETRFYYKVVEAQITFVKDGSGNVSSLILHQYGRDTPAKKVQ